MGAKAKVNPSFALEGTMVGALHRKRFANHISTWEGYQTLMSYLKHDSTCSKHPNQHKEPDDASCDCGLGKLLRQGDDG